MNPHSLSLAENFIATHVAAAARELEQQQAEHTAAFLMAISRDRAREVLMQMLPAYSARLLDLIPLDIAGEMLKAGNSDQLAAILRLAPRDRRSRLLMHIPDRLAVRCRIKIGYATDSVGAWMETDILLLPDSVSVDEALRRLATADNIGDAARLPLVNENRNLVGVVDIKDLLRSRRRLPIEKFKRPPDGLVLQARTSLRSAMGHAGWQTSDCLIVLNQQRQPEGMLRHAALRAGLGIAAGETAADGNASSLRDFIDVYQHSLGAIFGLFSGHQRQLPPTAASLESGQ